MRKSSKNIIAVVFGGVSNENEISVITGTMAANVLKKGGESVLPVYISQSGQMYSDSRLMDIKTFSDGQFNDIARCIMADGGIYILNKRGKIKTFLPVRVALNCCHGGLGEGGGLYGLCTLNKIPLAGGDMYSSSAFMDKYYTKQLLSYLKVPALPFALLRSLGDITGVIKQIGLPCVIKPARLGSSIGVCVAHDMRALEEGVACALTYDTYAIAEPYLAPKRELNCAAYFSGGVHLSEIEEVFTNGDMLSFGDKYEGSGRSQIPADIDGQTAQKIGDIVTKVYLKTGMRGIARFDFLLSGGELYLSEVNSVPGSLSYYLFCKNFQEFYNLLIILCEQAISDFAVQSRKRVIKTGILNSLPTGNAKLGSKLFGV